MRSLSGDLRLAGVLVCVTLLAGCATDAPVRERAVAPKKDVPAVQASKGIGMGRVEAVREVAMVDTAQPYRRGVERNMAADGLSQTMIGMLSPKSMGVEVFVRLDSGADVTVVQAADVAFRPGDRVRVMQGRDGATRVTY